MILNVFVFRKRLAIVYSEIPFRKTSHHTETSQLVCKANQLAEFYTRRVFTERCFRDYNFSSNYNYYAMVGC